MMRCLKIQLVFTLLVALCAAQPSRSYSEKLRNFLENDFRDIMRNGNESMEIPVLDPLYMEKFDFKIAETAFSVEGILANFESKGVSNYAVTEAKVEVLKRKMTVGMRIPLISSSGTYKFNGLVLDKIPAYGEGEYKLQIKDFEFLAEVVLSFSGALSVSSLDLQISVQEVQLAANGIYNDDSLSTFLSILISDMAPEFIVNYHDDVTGIVSKRIIELANERLKDLSISDLLGVFG